MTNPFSGRSLSLSGPATDASPVVPDDGVDLPKVAVALYIESAGDISFISQQGETRTIAVADFMILPIGASRVLATGTTATGIHAMTVS